MRGREFEQLGVAARRVVVLVQFELDVSARGKQIGSLLARVEGVIQLLERVLQLAFEVQRDGLGHRRRSFSVALGYVTHENCPSSSP